MRPAVYILANRSNTVLYTGVTSDLRARHTHHVLRTNPGCFTARYNVTKLVYFEAHATMVAAIAREKQLKGGSRGNKIRLIVRRNPEWRDLSIELFATA